MIHDEVRNRGRGRFRASLSSAGPSVDVPIVGDCKEVLVDLLLVHRVAALELGALDVDVGRRRNAWRP